MPERALVLAALATSALALGPWPAGAGPALALEVALTVANEPPFVAGGGVGEGSGSAVWLWVAAADPNGAEDVARAGFVVEGPQGRVVVPARGPQVQDDRARFEASVDLAAGPVRWVGVQLTDAGGAEVEVPIPDPPVLSAGDSDVGAQGGGSRLLSGSWAEWFALAMVGLVVLVLLWGWLLRRGTA